MVRPAFALDMDAARVHARSRRLLVRAHAARRWARGDRDARRRTRESPGHLQRLPRTLPVVRVARHRRDRFAVPRPGPGLSLWRWALVLLGAVTLAVALPSPPYRTELRVPAFFADGTYQQDLHQR